MFRESNKAFRIAYFMSAILPINMTLVVSYLCIYTEISVNKKQVHILWNGGIGVDIFGLGLLLLFMSGIFALIYTNWKVNELYKNKGNGVEINVKLSNRFNTGFSSFVLSMVLPLVSSFSLKNNEVYCMVMIALFEFLIFYFYQHSSDFFANVCLKYDVVDGIILEGSSIAGYRLQKGDTIHVFVKHKELNKLIGKKCEVYSTDNNLNLCVRVADREGK